MSVELKNNMQVKTLTAFYGPDENKIAEIKEKHWERVCSSRKLHKFTREQPSRNERSIIDFILVGKENKAIVTDCKNYKGCGYQINSDNYLLVAEIKILKH